MVEELGFMAVFGSHIAPLKWWSGSFQLMHLEIWDAQRNLQLSNWLPGVEN